MYKSSIKNKSLNNAISNHETDSDNYKNIVRVFSVVDEGILSSILHSSDIETKSDSTHFQQIQFGTLIPFFEGIKISVKESDVLDAKEIIEIYINGKKRIQQYSDSKEKVKKQLSLLFCTPALHREIPELLI